MKVVATVLLALSLLLPSVSFAKVKGPDVLDKEDIKVTEGLSKYKTVGVKVFTTEGIKYKNVDDEEMKKMKRFLTECQEKMAKSMVDSLKDRGMEAFVIDDEKGAGKADMVIEGSISEMNLGSRAMRILLTFSGQAGVAAKGELKDAKTGQVLASFEHRKTSGLGEGDKWDMVLGRAGALGEDVAEFVEKLRQ